MTYKILILQFSCKFLFFINLHNVVITIVTSCRVEERSQGEEHAEDVPTRHATTDPAIFHQLGGSQ